MRLYKKVHFRLNKSDKTGDVFRIIMQALQGTEFSFYPAFYAADYASDSRLKFVSAVDRLTKKYPLLKKYEGVEVHTDTNRAPSKYLSTLGEGWNVPAHTQTGEITPELLEAIADGIPRSYPAHHSTFVFDQIDWNGKGETDAPAPHHEASPRFPSHYHYPSVILQSDWWISGRTINLWATVDLAVPDEGSKSLSEISQKAQQCIEKLGKVQKEELIIVPSREKELELIPKMEKAKEITRDYDRLGAYWQGSNPLPDFPYSLPDPYNQVDTEESVSPKKVIQDLLKPRGYRYRSNFSGLGTYHLVKRLPSHNRVVLEFDFAPMARALSCTMYVQGMYWKHGLDVKYSNGITPCQYSIKSAESLDMAVANMAAAIDFLEREYVPKLEDIYGDSPEWIEY
jgi:hypothetical protein